LAQDLAQADNSWMSVVDAWQVDIKSL